MQPGEFGSTDPRNSSKLLSAKKLLDENFQGTAARWVWVDVERQRLVLAEGSREVAVWPVSTGRAGIDGRLDSYGTPPGVHVIRARIGDGQPTGMVFRSRVPTGEVWPDTVADGTDTGDLILTRILTLDGLQEGLNRGPGCDTFERYIYIHGTNHEARIGTPVSHGCVRMRSDDLLDLFARVEAGDPVVIA